MVVIYLWCCSGIFNTTLCQVNYKVINLTPSNLDFDWTNININGEVVLTGPFDPVSQTQPVILWKIGSGGTVTGTLSGHNYSAVGGINDSGQVVGFSGNTQSSTISAFLWENGTMSALLEDAYASDINNMGQVVGSHFEDEITLGFLWENGGLEYLDPIEGHINSYANGINDEGQVAGYSVDYESEWQINLAVLWQNGGIISLGTLGGDNSEAFAINNSSQVVGTSQPSGSSFFHAFIWESGAMTDLGTLGFSTSVATGINDSGQVVGVLIGEEITSAFLWENGNMTDLNDLIDPASGWQLLSAHNINDKGMIVGQGIFYNHLFAFLLYRPEIEITRPSAEMDTLWIAGEKDTIRWNILKPGAALQLEYSTNSGQSFHLIEDGIYGDSSYYVWDIPDTILSTKCMIRITDMYDPEITDDSDILNIKGYVLTKYDSNDDYVPYKIPDDAWGFRNTQLECFPSSWWTRFDYQGVDPYTGMHYSQWEGDSVFAKAESSDFPDWSAIVNTFGTGACYKGLFYSPTVLKRWKAFKKKWNGSCFGMATSNLLVWKNKPNFQSKYTDFPNFGQPNEVTSDTNTYPVINELHTHQFGKPHRFYTFNFGWANYKTPKQILTDIKQMLITDDAELRVLICRSNDTTNPGAHALVPYRVRKDPAFSDIFYVDVYDVNQSQSDHVSFVTSLNNGDGWWSYSALNWNGNKSIFLVDDVSTYLVNPTLNKFSDQSSPFFIAENELEIYPSNDSSVVIQDMYGNLTGFNNGYLQNGIQDASPLIAITGSESLPYGYHFTADNYSITINQSSENESEVIFFTGNKTFSCTRSDASQNQTDRFFFDGGVSTVNPDQDVKEFSLLNIINETTQEKLFVVRSVAVAKNDSVKIENVDDDKLKFSSYGSAKSYNIELNFVSENGLDRFIASDILLDANTSHTIIPEWTDLTNSQLFVLVDNGNDGTIDDTLFLVNQITGIGDEQGSLLSPYNYNLEQNYPNPFNPVTKIKYSIAQNNLVSIKIYDILGREVETLVNEEKHAGFYEVEFNASEISSGIYFYKLTSGSFSKTKKMILLK